MAVLSKVSSSPVAASPLKKTKKIVVKKKKKIAAVPATAPVKKKKITGMVTAHDDKVMKELEALGDSDVVKQLRDVTSRKLTLKLDLMRQVRRNKMTKKEADQLYKIESMAMDRETTDFLDRDNIKGEDDPAIMYGRDASKKVKRGQFATNLQPYSPDVSVLEVGTLPEDKAWKPIKIRFDYNNIFCIERIVIPGKSGHPDISYWAWAIKKVKRGESDTDEKVSKSGKKYSPFNFSGKLSLAPELHLALRHQLALAKKTPPPTVRQTVDAGDKYKDVYDIIDIFSITERDYPMKVISFGEFRCYIEDCPYKTFNGTVNFHKVREKTEKGGKRIFLGLVNFSFLFSFLRCSPSPRGSRPRR